MKFLDFFGQIFEPLVKVIDEVHTSDEEKRTLENEVQAIRANLMFKFLDYEKEKLSRQADIVIAEAQGESALQRNWRPVTMLGFVFSVMAYWFGITPDDVPQESIDNMFLLVQIGLGGYVAGRSAEKIAKVIAPALGKKGAEE